MCTYPITVRFMTFRAGVDLCDRSQRFNAIRLVDLNLLQVYRPVDGHPRPRWCEIIARGLSRLQRLHIPHQLDFHLSSLMAGTGVDLQFIPQVVHHSHDGDGLVFGDGEARRRVGVYNSRPLT